MKKLFAALLILISSTIAQATDFSFLPAQTDAQKEFKSYLENSEFEQALSAWPKAFEGSSFAVTENGRALHLYLIAQNGMPVSALKMVAKDTFANHLNKRILELWQPIANTFASELPPGLEFNASWTRLFSSQINEPTKVWRASTLAASAGKSNEALNGLLRLKSMKQNVIGDDQIELALARTYYQMGDVDEALKHYSQIPKSSDFWLESVEERAWAALRKNQHDKAVSDITTLMSPAFVGVTGPEAFFLSELSSLKVCDYPKILKTSQLFKERHKDRLVEIEKLAKTGNNTALAQVMSDFDSKGFNIRAAGTNFKFLPRNFMRDRIFSSQMKYRFNLVTEFTKAQELAKDLPGDNEIQKILAKNQSEADKAKVSALARLKNLAAADMEEYRIIINKLHIVEAEVIQRLYVDERLKGKRNEVASIKGDRNTFVFPVSDKEVWLDELDKYKSSVKECPALPSTKEASL